MNKLALLPSLALALLIPALARAQPPATTPASQPAPSALVDPAMLANAPVVLRVKWKSISPPGGNPSDTVQVLQVIKNDKNDSAKEWGKTARMDHEPGQDGVPHDQECTVYLEINKNLKGSPWALLGGGAKTGVSNIGSPDLRESDPVRESGLDFQVIAPAKWLVPSSDKGVNIPLALKITNSTNQEVILRPEGTLTLILKDSAGKELPLATGADSVKRPEPGPAKELPPLTIPAGQSATLARPAQLRRANDKENTFWLAGQNGSDFWRFDALKPGKYTLAMHYENQEDGPPSAIRASYKVTTNDLPIEIVDQPPAKN